MPVLVPLCRPDLLVVALERAVIALTGGRDLSALAGKGCHAHPCISRDKTLSRPPDPVQATPGQTSPLRGARRGREARIRNRNDRIRAAALMPTTVDAGARQSPPSPAYFKSSEHYMCIICIFILCLRNDIGCKVGLKLEIGTKGNMAPSN